MKQSKQKTSEHVIRLANTETVTVDEESWKKGRRMIDLFYVAKQLFCRQCKEALALINSTSEKNMGYASHLFIRCECGQVNQIETSETHVHGKRGPQVYDVNTKAALGI